jgi:spermidine synthase
VLGLVARADGGHFDPAALRARLAAFSLPARRDQLQLSDDFAVLGNLIAGPAELRRFAAGAALNTDDRPVVAHRAPFITYAPDSLPRERLLALLHALKPQPEDLLVDPADPQSALRHRRLAAYWQARTQFIEAGMKVQPSSDPQAMLAQVQLPLLSIVRASPDFRPAYDPLLNLARALARADAPSARSLLAELVIANPARPEAALLMQRLDAAALVQRPAP